MVLDNLLENLKSPATPTPSIGEALPPYSPPGSARKKLEKFNFDMMDMPIPGQSLTSELGQMPYEQPPQFTDLSKLTDFIFDRLTTPNVQRRILQLLDAGVPVSVIAEPFIMQGASEGKYNIDLAMLVIEPVITMIAGLGIRAGINVKAAPKKDISVIDTQTFEKAFKDKKEVEEGLTETPELKRESLVIKKEV
jgi:hypothetical protein